MRPVARTHARLPDHRYRQGMMADRAKLLKDLGIDVWRLRPGADNVVNAPGRQVESSPEHAVSETTSTREASLTEVPPQERPAQKDPAGKPAVPLMKVPDPIDDFTVVCVRRGDATYVMCTSDLQGREKVGLNAARRFALDVLAIMAGSRGMAEKPGQPVSELVFDWPQPGVDNTREHASKALGAFVDKQLDDAGSGPFAVCEKVARLLADDALPGSVIRTPDLIRLLHDGELKKALWRQLQKS